MEYFDANHIPDGFLRARFKTASAEETLAVMRAFNPVVQALLKNASPQEKLRIGFMGEYGTGKSHCASQLLEQSIQSSFSREFLPEKVSKHFIDTTDNWHSHYDAYAIEMAKARSDYHELVANDMASHTDHAQSAIAHYVEWPECDTNLNFNAIWALSTQTQFMDRENASDRDIALYVTDEIMALPETQKFLQDTQHLRIA
ncbi:MAG: hypothetical protein GW778_06665 [Alphaproteobacteria bacterium]|nr:hypothetical protein [Alphaproteobacteria bacterium]